MHHDVIIVGGSFAGLSAALYIARTRRSVCVLDTHSPRNRFASQAHGFLTQDGQSPRDILNTARSQVAAYPTVSLKDGQAVSATREESGFSITLATGEVMSSHLLILAFGVRDELPDLPGLGERWGHSVLHCPYCHGYEFASQRLGVLYTSPMSFHQSLLIAEWGPTTLYLNGHPGPDPESRAKLEARGVEIEPARIEVLHGAEKTLSSLELEGGRRVPIAALYLGSRTHLNSDIAQQLGCELEDGAFGKVIRVNEMKETTVPGVFAAGDITRTAHTITWANTDGVTAALSAHRSMIM
ncbi:NAD(P)/FAD-dependent oxidoreductase [Deinococcus sp. Leaf326]|uniref:NAD(P)/FAD-dependent oxidoreductase n=1 Tax=Deinococcus sp. Leaf326 TaxID=1736338 RepID=UPI0006F50942|nr:NAD(P)/FAD-dependent oxidoreductase [Deinococcus sp. Leaf326]KQR18855.1 thioredoxin reductase [Deinococcus sp. Leaf326]